MTHLDPLTFLLLLLALIGGVGLGYVHFRTLHAISFDYIGGHPARAALIQLGRMVIMAGVLILLAWAGALYLLCGALGVLIGRFMVMHKVGKEP